MFDRPFAELCPVLGSVKSDTELPDWIKLLEGEEALGPPSKEFYATGGCGFGYNDRGEDTMALGWGVGFAEGAKYDLGFGVG